MEGQVSYYQDNKLFLRCLEVYTIERYQHIIKEVPFFLPTFNFVVSQTYIKNLKRVKFFINWDCLSEHRQLRMTGTLYVCEFHVRRYIQNDQVREGTMFPRARQMLSKATCIVVKGSLKIQREPNLHASSFQLATIAEDHRSMLNQCSVVCSKNKNSNRQLRTSARSPPRTSISCMSCSWSIYLSEYMISQISCMPRLNWMVSCMIFTLVSSI